MSFILSLLIVASTPSWSAEPRRTEPRQIWNRHMIQAPKPGSGIEVGAFTLTPKEDFVPTKELVTLQPTAGEAAQSLRNRFNDPQAKDDTIHILLRWLGIRTAKDTLSRDQQDEVNSAYEALLHRPKNLSPQVTEQLLKNILKKHDTQGFIYLIHNTQLAPADFAPWLNKPSVMDQLIGSRDLVQRFWFSVARQTKIGSKAFEMAFEKLNAFWLDKSLVESKPNEFAELCDLGALSAKTPGDFERFIAPYLRDPLSSEKTERVKKFLRVLEYATQNREKLGQDADFNLLKRALVDTKSYEDKTLALSLGGFLSREESPDRDRWIPYLSELTADKPELIYLASSIFGDAGKPARNTLMERAVSTRDFALAQSLIHPDVEIDFLFRKEGATWVDQFSKDTAFFQELLTQLPTESKAAGYVLSHLKEAARADLIPLSYFAELLRSRKMHSNSFENILAFLQENAADGKLPILEFAQIVMPYTSERSLSKQTRIALDLIRERLLAQSDLPNQVIADVLIPAFQDLMGRYGDQIREPGDISTWPKFTELLVSRFPVTRDIHGTFGLLYSLIDRARYTMQENLINTAAINSPGDWIRKELRNKINY